MSAHAETSGHEHHHGPPVANRSSRLDSTTLGMFLFIGSEAMLFGAFFTAYFFVRVVNPLPRRRGRRRPTSSRCSSPA